MALEPLVYSVDRGICSGIKNVPASKSFTNRALILASLCKKPITLLNISTSSDVLSMISCLEKVGLKIKKIKGGVKVINSFPRCETEIETPLEIKTGDGGTTNRFLISLLSRGRREYRLQPEMGMKKRPMEELFLALRELGAIAEKEKGEFIVQGPLIEKEKKIEINSIRSTQFITGVLMACFDLPHIITPTNMKNSKKYFDMTQELIESFKVETTIIVPTDFSSLSYPLAYALVGGDVFIPNCTKRDELQADSIFLDLIEKMGGKYFFSKEGLKIQGTQNLSPIDIDCSGFPDLAPTLIFPCAYAQGVSYLRNLEVLRHKECDRVEGILEILKIFGVKHDYHLETGDLEIHGSSPCAEPVVYIPPKDHRMIMGAYLFMKKNKGGEIHHAEHVEKSYPMFFEEMEESKIK